MILDRTIKETFEEEYHKSIEEVVCKETGGDFEKLLMSIMAFSRDDSASSPSDVADELINEGKQSFQKKNLNKDNNKRIVKNANFYRFFF